jgi:hypothetical protein
MCLRTTSWRYSGGQEVKIQPVYNCGIFLAWAPHPGSSAGSSSHVSACHRTVEQSGPLPTLSQITCKCHLVCKVTSTTAHRKRNFRTEGYVMHSNACNGPKDRYVAVERQSSRRVKKITQWGLLDRVVFWLYTSASEDHAASIFRVAVRMVRIFMAYVGLGGGWGKGVKQDWLIRAMGGWGGGKDGAWSGQ